MDDQFSGQLNQIYSNMSRKYLEIITGLAKPERVKVMLADAGVTEQETFDPKRIQFLFELLRRNLENWTSDGISKTDTDDLRRLHMHINTKVQKYIITCYFALQYHALPYYKFDSRIKDIQVQIMELDEKIEAMRQQLAEQQNAVIEKELSRRKIEGLDFEKTLEMLYNDQSLYDQLVAMTDHIEKEKPEYIEMTKQRDGLVKNLKDMVIELYRTSPVLIGHNQLMQGEEGATLYFDIELVRGKEDRIGAIEPTKIPDNVKDLITRKFNDVSETLQHADGYFHQS